MSKFDLYSEVIFWDFLRKNNVNYNFKIIETLVSCQNLGKDKIHFYKPIYLLLASIIECTLFDFLLRIKIATNEKIPNLDSNIKESIKNKNIPNKLHNFNEVCKKYNLLEDHMYGAIEKIANIRNRIHIQNQDEEKPTKEWELWSNDRVKECGNLLKEMYLLLMDKHPRPDCRHTNPPNSNFPEPWNSLK